MASIPQPTMDGLPNVGRVPELLTAPPPSHTAVRTLYAERPGATDKFHLEAVNGWYMTRLNQAFFSAENIDYLQHQIRYRVYQLSGNVIDPQNVDELKRMMMGVFYREARHVVGKEREEIAALDAKIVEEAAHDIVGAIAHRQYYWNDIANPMQILDRGSHTSSAGTRTPAGPLPDPF